jgi:hypothetical protein
MKIQEEAIGQEKKRQTQAQTVPVLLRITDPSKMPQKGELLLKSRV